MVNTFVANVSNAHGGVFTLEFIDVRFRIKVVAMWDDFYS